MITSDAYFGNEPGCTGLGDLVTQTTAGGQCGPFAEGHRFATDADDLSTLRDDSILVLVIVTDDPPFFLDQDDAHLDTDTSTWNPSILAAKANDPNAVVVIGFIPFNDISCVGPPAQSTNLIDFVTSFGPQGAIASVCVPDFGPAFDEVVSTIETTCHDFEPPG